MTTEVKTFIENNTSVLRTSDPIVVLQRAYDEGLSNVGVYDLRSVLVTCKLFTNIQLSDAADTLFLKRFNEVRKILSRKVYPSLKELLYRFGFFSNQYGLEFLRINNLLRSNEDKLQIELTLTPDLDVRIKDLRLQ